MDNDFSWMTRAMEIGDSIARGIGISWYAVVKEVGDNQRVIVEEPGRWLNEKFAIEFGLVSTSTSPVNAQIKAMELVAKCPKLKNNVTACSPALNDERFALLQWKGGVRIGRRVIATSGRPQEHDQLLSAIMHMAGNPLIAPSLDAVLWIKRTGKSIPIINLKTINGRALLSRVSSICGVQIELENDLNKPLILVEKSKDDDRGPGIIGLTAVSR